MARLIRYLLLLVFLAGLIVAAVVALKLWDLDRKLPSIEGLRDLKLQEPLRVYTGDGKMIGEFGAERREPLRYDEFPRALVNAFLAAEDDRFFEHPGVDYQGLIRAALLLAVTGEKSQGGSTITMQLARNFFLSAERTYTRKLREILLALKIEKELSKREILEFYLNKIYLGNRAYGVGAASQIYYGRDLSELSVAETAMIAGLPKAPSRYNPVADPDRAKLRRNYVLRRMNELDYISDDEFQASLAAPLTAKLRKAHTDIDSHYAAEMARADIVRRYGTDAYINGLQVTTTIDARLQSAAVSAVQEGLSDYDRRHDWRGAEAHSDALTGMDWRQLDSERMRALLWPMFDDREVIGPLIPALVLGRSETHLEVFSRLSGVHEIAFESIPWPAAVAEAGLAKGDWIRMRAGEADWELAQLPVVQGALVSLNPDDGAIRALVGGFDYFRSKFNRAAQAQRQPGSSFKPFLYSAALDRGFNPASIINDAPVVFNDPALEDTWRPENYSGRFYGPTRLREALINSRNLVSIRLLQAVGVGPVRAHARKFGFDLRRLPRDLSMSLGSGTFSPLEMARAYSVFANGGFAVDTYLIDEIRDIRGEQLFKARPATACRECEPEPEPQADDDEVAATDISSVELSAEPIGAVTPAEQQPLRAERVISAENAYLMTDLMRDVVKRGTARKALQLGRADLAGKTGTTNDQRDAWFCGFTPEIVTTAWVGFDDLTPLGRGEVGGRAALPMWMSFMKVALEGQPERNPRRPAGIITARIDPETGLLASSGAARGVFELFMEGHVPARAAAGSAPVTAGGGEPAEDVLDDLF